MARRRERDSGIFRIYVSDRSGFEFGFIPITSRPNAYTRESGRPVQDVNITVAPTEFDTPPLSKEPLGGEGDVSNAAVAPNSNFDTPSNAYVIPANSTKIIVSVSSQNSIAWNQEPWVYVAGSLATQTMAVNPQVVAGAQSQQITLLCISNQITLITGSGLTLHADRFVMTSGSIINFMYQTSNLTWQETSRSFQYQDLGAL